MTENKQINGDLAVSGDATIGGGLNVQGKSTLKGNVRIEGWLDADNLRTPCKGLFADLVALQTAYPSPVDGWFAFVGNAFPADVYAVEDNEWVMKGKSGSVIVEGGGSADISGLESNVNALQTSTTELKASVNTLAGSVNDVKNDVATLSDEVSLNENKVSSIEALLKIMPLPFDVVGELPDDATIMNTGFAALNAKILFNTKTGCFVAYDSSVPPKYYTTASVLKGYEDPDNDTIFTQDGVPGSPYRIYINRQNGKFYKIVKRDNIRIMSMI